ncbi:HlyD family type I secretion periplasmic adaptor subunit [Actibacterium sp. 188UL27-1]|uniref:HlyD family type I secretion periplasmic adaptor subunit n=1 Tax=Actibacterium sp. 188UL27-1 TaxID=2786961 RepID=UPI00195C6CD7|nr:HlyD family type I secretion periplasmic adaptor subunit [Actibacterium sp. 188UL27-1]MBM7068663.1 HlyD family type I secretion periplasmic adaptor subunit [Actibacterium sp. 188UL27-1]
MSNPVFLVGRKPPRVFAWLIFLVCGLVSFAVFWAHNTVLPEIVRSSGEITPLGRLHNVGHYDGGVVDRILVRPGDRVAQGDLLAVIRKPDIEAEITRVRQQISAKEQDEARLQVMNTFLRREETPADGATPIELDQHQTWSSAQQYQLNQIDAYLRKRRTLEARTARALSSLKAARRVSQKIEARIASIGAREARALDLFNRGLTTVAQVEKETDILEQALSDALQADIRAIEAENRYSETLADIEDTRLAIQTEMQEELYRARVELDRLRIELELYEASMARSNILASADGTIQTVKFAARGEIVSPGSTVATILPENDKLVAKVRLDPSDIGHIDSTTPVRLGLTTFDVRRYGRVDGTIQAISPTSELNDRGEPFYEIVILLEKDHVEANGVRKSLRAGMEVSAEFLSEQRTVLEYFAGPIQSALSAAFTER